MFCWHLDLLVFLLICSLSYLKIAKGENGKEKKKILILQISPAGYDRQPFEWNYEKYPYSFVELSKLSASLYARRHGYDYQLFILDEEYLKHVGRGNCWMIPLAIKRALAFYANDYEFVVFVDLNVIFMDPEKSIEEKIQEWDHVAVVGRGGGGAGIQSDVYLGLDFDQRNHYFPQFLTTELALGFSYSLMVWKTSLKSRSVLEEWFACPDSMKGCQRFATCEESGSQTALLYLEKYLQLLKNFTIQRIDCNEVNGFPSSFRWKGLDGIAVGNNHCEGRFVSHFPQPNTKREAVSDLLPILFQQIMELIKKESEMSQELLPSEEEENVKEDGVFPTDSDLPIIKISFPYDHCINCSADVAISLSHHINTTLPVAEHYPDPSIYQYVKEVCLQYHMEKQTCQYVDEYINHKIKSKYHFMTIKNRKKASGLVKDSRGSTITENKNKRVLVMQAMMEGQDREPFEWDFEKYPYSFAELSILSASMYARRHGCDYKLFIVDEEVLKRMASHVNPTRSLAVKRALELYEDYYETIIYLDVSVIFTDPEKLIEEKMRDSDRADGHVSQDELRLDCNTDQTSLSNLSVAVCEYSSLGHNLSGIIFNRFAFISRKFIASSSSNLIENSLELYFSQLSSNKDVLLLITKLFQHVMEVVKNEIEENEVLLPENHDFPVNPMLHLKVSFRLETGYTADVNLFLSSPINTNLTLEQNYPDLSYYEQVREVFSQLEVEKEMCKYIEINIMQRIQLKYRFLTKLNRESHLHNHSNMQFINTDESILLTDTTIEEAKASVAEREAVIDNYLLQTFPQQISRNTTPTQIQPHKGEDEENSILFITAFKEIGRSSWSKEEFQRSTTAYCKYFTNLAYYLPSHYYLIIYLESEIKQYLFTYYPELALKSNLIFHDWHSVKDSFYSKYLTKEEEIMKSPLYRQKVPDHRKENPEHNSSQYTMIMHSKMNFVRDAYQIYPQFTYYCWIDFGHLRSLAKLYLLPSPRLNYTRFSRNQMISAVNTMPDLQNKYYDANEMLAETEHFIVGSHIIFPRTMILDFEKLYEQKIIDWQQHYIADDDQNLLLQLYQDHPDLFVFYSCTAYHLFANYLNLEENLT